MNNPASFRLVPAVETVAAFLAGLILFGSGVWSAASLVELMDVPSSPLGEVPLPTALLVTGAGVGIMLAAWQLFWLRRTAAAARDGAARANAERDLALLQARRMRAQAEGLALMREIHRSTAIPERHDRLHRILTLVGDLFEAREVTLFAAMPDGPLPVLPAACLRSGREEIFVSFDSEAFGRTLELYGSGVLRLPKVKDARLECAGGWLGLEGQVVAGKSPIAHIRVRLPVAVPDDVAAPQEPAQMLEAWLARLDFTPAACKQAAAALNQRRTLRLREALTVRRKEPSEDALLLNVPLIADQRPVGVLRIRRPVEGFDGPAAEALEEMLIESAKHIALALKKDEDDLKAITDQLTGLFIKRRLLEMLERLRAEALSGGHGFALVLCDIDHFKQVNDTHGHLTGDLVLKNIAQVLRSGLRAHDLAFRYGGEEMALLMPGAGQTAAVQTAERLRAAVQQNAFTGEKGQAVPVTISMGVALHQTGLTAEQLISRADQALYVSKHAGRNRVTPWKAGLPSAASEEKMESVIPAGHPA